MLIAIVVQVAYHHLEVALEEARAHADEKQGAYHEHYAEGVCGRRDGQAGVAREHHHHAGDHALAVTYAVGEYASENGHEVYQGQENCVNGACQGASEAELGLQEEHEDGEHGVVAEALAGVCECEGVETFRLVLEHRYNGLIVFLIYKYSKHFAKKDYLCNV